MDTKLSPSEEERSDAVWNELGRFAKFLPEQPKKLGVDGILLVKFGKLGWDTPGKNHELTENSYDLAHVRDLYGFSENWAKDVEKLYKVLTLSALALIEERLYTTFGEMRKLKEDQQPWFSLQNGLTDAGFKIMKIERFTCPIGHTDLGQANLTTLRWYSSKIPCSSPAKDFLDSVDKLAENEEQSNQVFYRWVVAKGMKDT